MVLKCFYHLAPAVTGEQADLVAVATAASEVLNLAVVVEGVVAGV